jgi:hypothetical protein
MERPPAKLLDRARYRIRPVRFPTVFTKAETIKIISMITGFHQIMVKILYGKGPSAEASYFC